MAQQFYSGRKFAKSVVYQLQSCIAASGRFKQEGSGQQATITHQLWCSSGYISVWKSFPCANSLEDQLLLCLYNLLDGGDDAHTCAEKWLYLVDRGGLMHVNEAAFQAFWQWNLNSESIFTHNAPQTSSEKSTRNFLQKVLLSIGQCCQVTGKRVKASTARTCFSQLGDSVC